MPDIFYNKTEDFSLLQTNMGFDSFVHCDMAKIMKVKKLLDTEKN